MKKIVIGLLLIGFTTALFSQTKKIKTYHDYWGTIIKESYSVLVSNPTKKHGYYKFYEKNTVVALEGNYTNGNMTGKWIKRSLYTGEIILIMYSDNNGSMDGIEKRWCEDKGHKLQFEGKHSHGKQIGIHKTYFCESGKIKIINEYNNDGKRDGKRTEYYKNGNIKMVEDFSNGVYIAVEDYNEAGQIISKDNKETGLQQKWYPNGQLKQEGVKKQGNKQGEWTGWDQDGTVIFEDTFVDGESEKEIAVAKAKKQAQIKAQKEAAERKERFRVESEKQQALLEDYKRTNKVLLGKYKKVESLYLVPDEWGGVTIKGKTYRIKKKNLYKAYHIYYDETVKLTIGLEDDYKFRTQITDSLIELCDKMVELFGIKTKNIEKQLKGVTDPSQIAKILWKDQ